MKEAAVLGTASKMYGPGEPAESEVLNMGVPAKYAALVDAAEDSEYLMAIRHLPATKSKSAAGNLEETIDSGETGGESIPLLPRHDRNGMCCATAVCETDESHGNEVNGTAYHMCHFLWMWLTTPRQHPV